jgi:hypothetical protein
MPSPGAPDGGRGALGAANRQSWIRDPKNRSATPGGFLISQAAGAGSVLIETGPLRPELAPDQVRGHASPCPEKQAPDFPKKIVIKRKLNGKALQRKYASKQSFPFRKSLYPVVTAVSTSAGSISLLRLASKRS